MRIVLIFMLIFLSGCNKNIKIDDPSLYNTKWTSENISIEFQKEKIIITNHATVITVGEINSVYVYNRVPFSSDCFANRPAEYSKNYFCYLNSVNIPDGSFHNFFTKERPTYAYMLFDKNGSIPIYYQFLDANNIMLAFPDGTGGNVIWLTKE